MAERKALQQLEEQGEGQGEGQTAIGGEGAESAKEAGKKLNGGTSRKKLVSLLQLGHFMILMLSSDCWVGRYLHTYVHTTIYACVFYMCQGV